MQRMRLLNRLHATLSPVIYGSGLAVVPPNVNAAWPERQFLRRLLQRLQVDCVFDVGANVGQYGVELRLLGYHGLIFSFEPGSAPFAALSERAASDPHWHVFNVALGSSAGEGKLNEMGASVFNSFLAPSTAETSKYDAANTVAKTSVVPIDTLSAMLPRLREEHGFGRPFLKLDTQGYDLEVFRGARAVWSDIVAMQSELAIKRIYQGVPLWFEAIGEYAAGGFELTGLFNVNPQDEDFVELNCYLVRK